MIDFFTDERVAMPALRKGELRKWLSSVAMSYGKRVGNLCYQFCDDEHILEANRQFLAHDYYTDIITFDTTEGDRLGGDMLISLDTVASNAEGLGVSYEQELHRVLVHGVLHLIGLRDKTEAEAVAMRAAEDRALAMLVEQLAGKTLFRG